MTVKVPFAVFVPTSKHDWTSESVAIHDENPTCVGNAFLYASSACVQTVQSSADQQGVARGFSTIKKNLGNGLDLPLLQTSLVRPHQSSRIAAQVDRNVVHPSNIAILGQNSGKSE